MSINDPVGDMLTRVRNGQSARKSFVLSPASKERASVLEVLKSEGYIRGYSIENVRKNINQLRIELKYVDMQPVIRMLKRVSKPGLRIYSSVSDLPSVRSGLGIHILSTSRGIMTDVAAKSAGVGGEVICQVF